ncbi:MAG: metal-sensing transcriptional repressor [Rhabdaerophilum sp.]
MTVEHTHTSHPAIVKRLKRAEGHLRGVISMIETGRACVDIAQQLHAVESAVAQAKRTLIRDHLDHCLGAATDSLSDAQKDAVAAFRDITRYL